MKTEIIGPNAFQSLRVELEAGEHFFSEAGKMVRMSTTISSEVQGLTGAGDVMSGINRLLAHDTFTYSKYTANAPGEVVIAPILPGNVGLQYLDGQCGWHCTGGSYLASGSEVNVKTEWQGRRGVFSGESIMFVRASGIGPLAFESFGMITEEDVNGTFCVDTGHLVGFEDTLEYSITTATTGWIKSFLSGEGFVIKFRGRGKVLMQSHNTRGFGSLIGPKLPLREHREERTRRRRRI